MTKETRKKLQSFLFTVAKVIYCAAYIGMIVTTICLIFQRW